MIVAYIELCNDRCALVVPIDAPVYQRHESVYDEVIAKRNEQHQTLEVLNTLNQTADPSPVPATHS